MTILKLKLAILPDWFWLAIIVVLGLVLRLHQLSAPLADWHSFRQADTASVAREYVKHGIDLLVPRYHDLSNIQSGEENPEGYRMVEFPVISGLVALLYTLISNFDIELHVLYRLVTIGFSLGTVLILYMLTKQIYSSSAGLLASLVFAILPFSVFYSRTILPDTPMVFFALLHMYALFKYISLKTTTFISPYYWLALVTGALALLIKPYAIFTFVPLLVLAMSRYRLKLATHVPLISYAFLVILPFILWRQWIEQFPSGIPASDWLYNQDNIRFSGAFFRWIFAERLGELILGFWGLIPLGIGMMRANKADQASWVFFSSWTAGMLAYLWILAGGNVRHDYYQILLIPLVSILVARGILYLVSIKHISAYALALASMCFMLMFSYYQIRQYYGINNPAIVAAGQAVERLTPPDSKVIAPYMGDTAFLYQTNRTGWPLGFEIEDKIAQGADYYVSVNWDDEARALAERYVVLEQTEEYVLIRLTGK